MGKNPPELQPYSYYGDTEFGKNSLNLGRTGYNGLANNVDKVNTIDPQTQADINSRINNIGNRARSDFNIDYNDNMAKTLANQYGRMGTMGATANLYRNDMNNRTAQRALADFNYNQAQAYQSNVDRELQRRYNAINMYKQLFGMGNDVASQDYRMSLTNQDRAYQNDFNRWRTEQNTKQAWIDAGLDVAGLALGGLPGLLMAQGGKTAIGGL